jgi:hypothetical protein
LRALKTLPLHYKLSATLDLSKNRLAAIGVNVAAVACMLLFGWLAIQLLAALYPDVDVVAISVGGTGGAGGQAILTLALVALTVLALVLHEAVHGVFFWLFTRERPVFGFRLQSLCLYAGAPDWYLPRDQHLVVGLAPFVLITLVGLALLLIIPGAVAPALLLVVVVNAAGGAGDLLMQPGCSYSHGTRSCVTWVTRFRSTA